MQASAREGEDIDPKAAIDEAGLSGSLERLLTEVSRGSARFFASTREFHEIQADFTRMLTLHRRNSTLNKELAQARSAIAENMTEENFAKFQTVQNELFALQSEMAHAAEGGQRGLVRKSLKFHVCAKWGRFEPDPRITRASGSYSCGRMLPPGLGRIRMAKREAAAESKKSKDEKESGGDSPLLDMSDAAVKKMIRAAKKRGFITYEALNLVMTADAVSSEQIEDVLAQLNEMGINVIEADEADADAEEEEDDEEEEEPEGGELVAATTRKVAKKAEGGGRGDRTDDPVRMYLREMGTVELLSREGEIAIAKRIEAGREAMIAGLCESPLTFQAIIIWHDELVQGKILLRDIIDLEATYAGPEVVPPEGAVDGTMPPHVPPMPMPPVVVAPPPPPPPPMPRPVPAADALPGEDGCND